jgi:hypothetical protein
MAPQAYETRRQELADVETTIAELKAHIADFKRRELELQHRRAFLIRAGVAAGEFREGGILVRDV